jgi:hypothetical protein
MPHSCSRKLRRWLTAEESHQPFEVLHRCRQVELLAYKAHPAQSQSAESNVILQFCEECFHFPARPLRDRERGCLGEGVGTLPRWREQFMERVLSNISEPGQPDAEFAIHNILVRFIKPAARKLGLDWVNWRSLRTSHAVWLKMAGADVKDAQGQMRHSRASTTLDIYQQFVPESQRLVVNKLSILTFAIQ